MFKLIATGLLSYGLIFQSSKMLKSIDSIETAPIYVAPPKYLQHMIFGYNQSTADSLWLRILQDFDLCQKQENQSESAVVRTVEAPKGITDKKMKFLFEHVSRANQDRKVCRQGWVFRMLDATTEIDPRFQMPYAAGALSLSILIDDYEGAGIIFDKAVERFPDDWRLLYAAAYHYLFDQKNLPKAAETLIKAGDAGAPRWVKSLAATIYTTQGQLELALSSLESLRPGLTTDEQRKNLDERKQVLIDQAKSLEQNNDNLSK